jgi:hypothetical protein
VASMSREARRNVKDVKKHIRKGGNLYNDRTCLNIREQPATPAPVVSRDRILRPGLRLR